MGDHHAIKVPWEPGLDLAAGFLRPWKPVRRAPMYQVSLIVVAATMLLIPIVYLGMIAAVGYFTYWHAVHDLDRFTDWGSMGRGRYAVRGAVLLFIVGYLGPLAGGLLVILSLLKPLVIPRSSERDGQLVDAASEPVVYAFVTRMCEVMGAPAPTRIEVDGSINASASTRGGLLGAVLSRQLVLTIGLPLVTGMNLNQLAAVLAHELGHFCQGTGMRAAYLIQSIQGWLVHAVYGRDRLDWFLVDFAQDNRNAGLGLAVMLARLCLFLARAVLWVLLMFSHLITLGMLRQMEHDADRHETRFAGSAAFESLSRRIEELGEATAAAQGEVRDYFRQNQLPDDLPALIADAAGRLSADAKDRVEKRLESKDSSFFSTHPAVGDRVARARARADEGVFALDVPARVLFKDLRPLCVRATRRIYRDELEGESVVSKTVSSADLLRVNARHTARIGEIARYLGFEPPDWRPLFPASSAIEPADDPRAALAKLKDARARLRELAPPAADAARKFRTVDETLVRCQQATAHFDARLGSLPKAFELAARSRDGVRRLEADSRGAAADAAAALDEALEAGSARLVWSLRVLLSSGAERVVPNADRLRERARAAYPALIALRDCLPAARTVRADFSRTAQVLGECNPEQASDEAKKVFRPLVDSCRDNLAHIRSTAGAVRYPFENPTGEITLAQRLIDDTPGWRDIGRIMATAERAIARYPEEVRRVTGELVEIARTVEEALARRTRERSASDAAAAPPR